MDQKQYIKLDKINLINFLSYRNRYVTSLNIMTRLIFYRKLNIMRIIFFISCSNSVKLHSCISVFLTGGCELVIWSWIFVGGYLGNTLIPLSVTVENKELHFLIPSYCVSVFGGLLSWPPVLRLFLYLLKVLGNKI